MNGQSVRNAATAPRLTGIASGAPWLVRGVLAACLVAFAAALCGPALALDAGLRERIDHFVESERQSSGIPGIALAIVDADGAVHARGFGEDGRGHRITADTPFPIGSLTKSFTALLVRQAIDAGTLDADAPVQRYLPWFRVADADASARITLRHLLNQTSGFSRADGIAPLLQERPASTEALARGLARVSLNRPVGERFEYSNLNFVVLGAVLEAVSGRAWPVLVQEEVLGPLRMRHSFTDPEAARDAGLTAVHRMWFGIPVAHEDRLPPGLVPTGGLQASASDMARYLRMLLAGGTTDERRVVTDDGVAQLLAPASAPARSRLLATEFAFRYGEGWFVGAVGAAEDARWHLGNLASFAAWMVVLPESGQAVVVLINANSELPFNDVNAVMSRLPVGVVNLLRGQEPPQGPSLRDAYRPFNVACVLALVLLAALAGGAARARRMAWSLVLLLVAIAIAVALPVMGLGARMLSAFAPDVALVVAIGLVLLCLPAALHAMAWMRRLVFTPRRLAPP